MSRLFIHHFHFLALVMLVSLLSCQTPAIELKPSTPIIQIKSLTPTVATAFEDDILLEIEYTDYDGDIGSEDPDEKMLSVQDSRLNEADEYHIPPIAPVGQEVPINGTLVVPLNRLFLLGNGQQEEVFFTVKMKDRAGNWSEEKVSPTITVNR